jgi:hypothetical protein
MGLIAKQVKFPPASGAPTPAFTNQTSLVGHPGQDWGSSASPLCGYKVTTPTSNLASAKCKIQLME